ncbi:MAG: DUF4230 domain-containing protein [Chthoniobacterales bacterium]|nr:DUF4230 domain-containing protein [Chthoniobacterales bacterium]
MELQTDRPAPEKRPRSLGCTLAVVLILFILALLATFVFYRLESWPGRTLDRSVTRLEELARKARDSFVELAHLQPKVTVNDRVYLEQTTTVAELAVLARRVQVEHEMMHTWAGSTKRIKLHGTYLVKAGFDLRQKFTVNIRPNDIEIELPHARILSVEQEMIEVQTLENGFWNRVSPGDVESQLAALPAQARAKAADLPAEAERTFTRQLLEKFRPEQPVRAIFPAPTPHG